MARLILAGCLTLSLITCSQAADLPPAADRPVDFVRDVQSLLGRHCLSCHDGRKQRGGFRLDQKAPALAGGETYAPAIVPGKSADSPLIRIVAGLEEGMVMPPEGARLTAAEIGILRAWIDQGATWPESASAVDDAASHWSFQPVVRPAVPSQQPGWARNPVDAFVAHRLHLAGPSGLTPSPEADRRLLIRRLTFDLLGLPPAPEDVDSFVADTAPDAYERHVDRLLASPQFGERWARHWLDIVRFAESDGFETNQPRPNAWPYRDYVIEAFNSDMPYSQFLTEQLAGDVVGRDEATGFLVGGAWDRVKSPDPGLTAQQRADELHDMVSTTGSAFLGLTVGCARCHNHKFDPVSQTDYYAIKAVFAGVQHGERALPMSDEPLRKRQREQLALEIQQIEAALAAFEPRATVVPRAPGQPVHLLLDDDSPEPNWPKRGVSQIVPRIGLEPHRAGTGPGQASDPGDASHLPNLGRNYSYWRNVAGRDVFTWNPALDGSFRIWMSWGCGWDTHATDARYLLDRDGDLATQDDQRELGRINQQRFADGKGGQERQPLWSGFANLGVHELSPTSRVVLRGGTSDAYVTADLVYFERVVSAAEFQSLAPPSERAALMPHLRPSVHRLVNVDRFAPVRARVVRFTIEATNTGAEPCVDELEIFSTERPARNAARDATVRSSSNLPGYPIHQLPHIHDGRYGNGASWISNEPGRGWVQFEWATPVEIERVVWSRDRTPAGPYQDRIPTRYRIEAGDSDETLHEVASSDDRLPVERNLAALPTRIGLQGEEQQLADELSRREAELKRELERLSVQRQVYAGRFTAPEPTFRLHRGDPLQPREPVVAAGLASFGSRWNLPQDGAESARRVQLARWMNEDEHPLTRRVLVNRLWQFHLGQGLVSTPSDLGRNGARPTHPELLDWLATESAEHADRPPVSLKRLHRLIVTASTYRQSAAARAEGLEMDAGGQLLWRFPPRRLEAEPLRDAILLVCGSLDDRMGGPGFDLFEPNTNYVKVYNSKHEFGPAEWRRMVYQSKPRMQLDDTFGQFDCPDAGQIAPRRTSSITALQALNLLNSQFIVQQASRFRDRLEVEAGPDAERQVRRAFQLAFQRDPEPSELSGAVTLIRDHGLATLCRVLLNSNEFLFVF